MLSSIQLLALVNAIGIAGESGPHARPCDVGWICDIVKQGQASGVPVFVKQLGANAVCLDGTCYPAKIALRDQKGADPAEWPAYLRVRHWPKGF